MNFYNFITDPTNNVKVNINSATAKKVIENYINYINTHSQQFGGSKQFTLPTHPKVGDEFHDNQRERDRNRRRIVRKKQFHDSRDLVVGAPAAAAAPEQAAEERLAKEAEDAARVTQEEVRRAKEAEEVQRVAEEAVRVAEAERLAKEAEETALAAEKTARAAEEARQAAEEAELASKAALAVAEEARRLDEVRIAQIKATELAKKEANRKEEERRAEEEIAKLLKVLKQVESETVIVQAKKKQIELDIKNATAIAQIKQDTKGINVAVLQLKDKLSADEEKLKTALPTEEGEYECVMCSFPYPPSKAFIIDAEDEECLCFKCIAEQMFNDDPPGQYLSDGKYDHHPPLTRVSLRFILGDDDFPANFADKRVWAKFRFDGDADNIDNPGHFSKMTTCLKRGVACRRKVNVADDEADEADGADGAATEEEVVDGVKSDFYIDATSFSFHQGIGGEVSRQSGMPLTKMITNYRANKYEYQRNKLATLKTGQEEEADEAAKSADKLSKLDERKVELEAKLGVDTAFGKFKNFLGMG